MEKLLSPQEVADIVGVPVKTVYQWNSKRTGPRVIRIGVHCRYRPKDLEAWIESNAKG